MEGKICDANNNSTSTTTPSSSSSSIGEDSTISNGSTISSSLDTTDDASSYSSGSLYDLSDLMSQLPIKRGLSKFYQGKSQSFTCLSRVGSIEDLAKKESPACNNRRRLMKASLDNYKSYTLPKPVISKKTSRGLISSSSFPNRRASFLISNCRPPPSKLAVLPLQRRPAGYDLDFL